MATQMTDPMDALISFQQAFRNHEISPQKGEIHSDLLVLVDHPNGVTRFTYALLENNRVVALAIFALTDPIEGSPCFSVGYAVDPAFRSQGYGTAVVDKAFDELTNGFKRAGVPHLYVEAIVSTSNEPSTRLAQNLFLMRPKECTDDESGQPALQYIRQLF